MSLADEFKRAIDPVEARRERVQFGIGTRWLIVQMRWTGATWRDRWRDLRYLVRG
jgi:hypothetical protein